MTEREIKKRIRTFTMDMLKVHYPESKGYTVSCSSLKTGDVYVDKEYKDGSSSLAVVINLSVW